jgi:3'-phosphoadenosine 5'-phosphosulfate sulfotransferase (PAPS reductase)/FAD synthetase
MMIFKVNESTGSQEYLGDKYLLSVSGGKDSTAMILYLKEIAARNVDYVFMDTGWESIQTYQYLDYLEAELGISINRIRSNITIKPEHETIYSECLNIMKRSYSDFVALILNKGMFPSGYAQYCTGELKVKPFQSFIDQLDYEPVSCVGIRREESQRRSTYEEYEYNEGFNCWVWRPLIEWSEADVIAIHHRHNIRPNPLYLTGAHRVGCYPCIRSNKSEMSQFPLDHKHLSVLRKLEDYHSARRNKDVTFFKGGRIDDVLDWAQTARGGRQYMLFDSTIPTCEKWGMCGI